MTGTERKRLIATVKPLSAHDYFEDNTPLEIFDDVEINSSNANDLIMIHDFIFFYFEIVRYLFFLVMPLKYPDIFAPFLLLFLRL
jgi:hypothetical protein